MMDYNDYPAWQVNAVMRNATRLGWLLAAVLAAIILATVACYVPTQPCWNPVDTAYVAPPGMPTATVRSTCNITIRR